jgi:hypothetical protein
MHDLVIVDPGLPGTLTTAEIDATMAYAFDWRDFEAWCAARGPARSRPTRAWSRRISRRSPIRAGRPPPLAAEPPPSGIATSWRG